MLLTHEYHSPDKTPALYVAPYDNSAQALQLTGTGLTNANALHVAIVDANGDQVISFGGGTQYTDAGVAAAHPVGTGIIFNNAGTYNFVSAAQPLPVTGSITVGGTTDNSAFTAGTTTGTPAMGFYHSTIDAVTDGRAAALAIDAKRNLFVVIRDAAGNARGLNIDGSGQLAVTGTFWQATQPISAASLPLPALAATSTKQSDGTQKTQIVDGSGNVIGATSNALDINIKSGNITGFATSTKQDTGNASLADIDTYIQKNLVELNALAARTSQFAIIKKNLLTSPQTTSGNPTITFDDSETFYIYKPAATNSSLYSYNVRTDTLTTLSSSLTEAYAGANIIYANGKLYYTRGGAFNTWSRINTDGTGNTALTNTSLTVNYAAPMVYDGSNLIYMRTNAGFQKYSISGDSWTALTAPTGAATEGGSLALVGKDRIYSLRGAGTTTYDMYKINNTSGNTDADTWTSKTAIPTAVYDGGALAWNGDNFIYALSGNGSQYFYRYDIGNNAWQVLAKLPVANSTGSNIIATNNGFFCYIVEPSNLNTTGFGTVNNLYFYDPTKNLPVPIAGRYNSSLPTYSNGEIGEVQIAADGALLNAPDTTTEGAADGISNTIRVYKDTFGFTPNQKTMGWIYNNTSWDRIRSMIDATNSIGTGIQSTGILAQFDNASPTSITENQFGNLRMSANRALHVMIRDNAGNERGLNIDASGQLAVTIASSQTIAVTNAGTFAVQESGTQVQVDDAAFTPATSKIVMAGATFDDVAPDSVNEGDGGALRMSANRNLYVNIRDNAGNERGLNVDANGAIAVTATNATASNLKVAATLDAETTKVIGTVRALGNGGATLDSTVGAGTAPTNQLVVGALYNSTEISPTTGQAFALQADSKGRLRGVIMDAAGNTRGANVDSSNRLSITLDNIAASQTLATITTVSTVTNLSQMNGAAITMGNGISGTGVQRVTIASDSTGQVALAAGSATIGALTANQSVNNAQIGGNTISTGVGATGTGTQRTVIANDAGRTLVSKGGTASSSGNNTLVVAGTNRLKVYAFSLSIVSTTAVTCIFQDGASGTTLWEVILQTPASVAGGANLVVQPPAWLFATSAATLLNLNLSAAVTVYYSLSYFDEA